MNKPTDYPVESPKTDSHGDQPVEDITLAMLSERVAAKQPVTDEMIRVARAKMDSAHSKSEDAKSLEQSKFKIGRIRDRFR